VVHNPGHTKKNFVKDLRNTFGNSKQYQKFPESIARWFMQCIKESHTDVRGQTFANREEKLDALLSQYKSLFLQLKWPKMAGGIKIYTNLALLAKFKSCMHTTSHHYATLAAPAIH